MGDDPRFRPLRAFFLRTSKDKSSVSEVLSKIPEFLASFEQTGDPYFDFSLFCAVILLETMKRIPDTELSIINTVRRMISVVINWGIYPHLPKSIHIKFLEDEPVWFDNLAPPRLLRPRVEMMDALSALFQSPGLALIQPLFLQHAISIFYYLAPDRIGAVLEFQRTEVIVASLLGLFPTGLRLTPLLMSTIMERSDSFEALEDSSFPPNVIAKVLAAPPSTCTEEEYYCALFKKAFDAIRSTKGGGLARLIVSRVANTRINHFWANFSMDALVDWPSDRTIAPIFWTINHSLFPEDLAKVLLPPAPHRALFVAIQTEGSTHDEASILIQNFLKAGSSATQFVLSIVEVASLSPLGLDGFQIVANEAGVFAFANDKENDLTDDLSLLEKMRALLAKLVSLSDVDDIVRHLPPTMEGIHFLSEVLPRFTSFAPDFSASLLLFLSKLDAFREIATDIARQVLEHSKSLASVPESVVSSFLVSEIPELALLSRVSISEPSKEPFDRAALLQDLTSPLVPLRARGLFTLRKGVQTSGHALRDESAIRAIFPSIEKQLQHADSFVFLSAVYCLEAIAVVFPHLVVETLTAQFPRDDEGVSLKVAQTLMLCVRRNGPGLVHSADGNLCGCFIRAFARGCGHPSDLIQASSLSNLASFVETLRFGVAQWFADITRTMDQAWQSHNPLQVRRAASYLAYKTVQALGTGFADFSPGDLAVLVEAVKRMRTGEFDEVAQQNAEDCYDCLWEICPMLL
jgi:hypothetical protein